MGGVQNLQQVCKFQKARARVFLVEAVEDRAGS